MGKTKLDTLPDDLLYATVSHLPVRDIICLRQTSKQFFRITSERTVWSQVYRMSRLLLPPGPYRYQSAEDLENILARADKLETNWALSRVVSRRTISEGLRGPICLSLLLGRWLLAGDVQSLRCYDLDEVESWAKPVAQIPVKVKFLDAAVVTSDEGLHSAFAVVHQMKNPIKIFKVHLPPSPTHFELVLEQHWPDNLPFTVNIGRDCLVVTTSRRILLMNIHTYQIFNPLPEPHCGPATNVGAKQFYVECVVTKTHLLVAYILPCREAWIEAFLLPSAASPILSRSHTTHCPFWFTSTTILRTSILRPTHDFGILTHEVVLLVSKGQYGPPTYDKFKLAMLRLLLQPDGTLSVDITHVETLDFTLFNLCITSNHGVARAIGYGSSSPSGLTRYGLRISEDAQVGYTVSHTELAEGIVVLGDNAFDGFGGRLCSTGIELSTVEIFDYV